MVFQARLKNCSPSLLERKTQGRSTVCEGGDISPGVSEASLIERGDQMNFPSKESQIPLAKKCFDDLNRKSSRKWVFFPLLESNFSNSNGIFPTSPNFPTSPRFRSSRPCTSHKSFEFAFFGKFGLLILDSTIQENRWLFANVENFCLRWHVSINFWPFSRNFGYHGHQSAKYKFVRFVLSLFFCFFAILYRASIFKEVFGLLVRILDASVVKIWNKYVKLLFFSA